MRRLLPECSGGVRSWEQRVGLETGHELVYGFQRPCELGQYALTGRIGDPPLDNIARVIELVTASADVWRC